MMIPEKIYVDSDELLRGAAYVEVSPSESNVIENPVIYILAPIAKRFDVEKPLKSGNYLISNHIPEPVWHWIDYYHADTNEWDTGSPYWFAEIILPTIPEEV